MIKNFIKIAWRNLLKGKAYSAINILGLSIGMAVALLIALWIWDELTFDQYHKNYKQVGQIMTTQTFNAETGTGPAVAMPLGNELRTKFGSNFKAVSMASWNFGHILAVGDTKISQEGMWVEPIFPAMFSLNMLKGNHAGLKDPSSIMISESVAKALFNDQDPLNKLIKLDNKESYKVSGVYEDFPQNTTLKGVKLFLSWEKYLTTEPWLKESMTQWGNHSFQAFVQINDQVKFDQVAKKIKNASMIHLKEAQDGREELVVQPMENWRLYNEFKNGKLAGGRIQFVWLFSIIGIFVLLLACINFMNLSTARSEKRAKEVGIRKTVGSLRWQLIGQFLSESILVAFFALLLSIALVQLLLPFFNGMADKKMFIPFGNLSFWMIILIFTLLTGLISGSYPAFYLSGFKPIKVLKGTYRVGKYASLPRKILVVIQFTVSITLIIGTIIVFKQIQYAKNRPVGYNREGLITIPKNTPDLFGHSDVVRRDLLATGMVENVAESSSPSTDLYSNQVGFDWEGKDPNSLPLFGIVAVTQEYGKTIDWKITEGRDFSRDFAADSNSLILNEAAVKLTKLKNIVGKNIKWNDRQYTVVGVIKDIVMQSPYSPVQPTIFAMKPDWAGIITVRIKPSVSVQDALAGLQKVMKKHNPGAPFDYKFTDEEYAKKFSDEERIGNLALFFAVLAIFISCLGLFGLASFVAEQRTKEIGVRKVLGATIVHIWKMLSKEFVLLVIVSFVIAVPIAWFNLHQWLQKYEYKTDISMWVFVISGIGAMSITLMTISFQAIKAAMANPVKSLRSE
ncbi:MAG: FtsX-like permease family protein [Sphingobacteriales bacterium]|nr:FtsX-like permease family protein [Sphingobacteriales bacterium]